jgi:penicillin-binding protein-related factor A (putative recombinase)
MEENIFDEELADKFTAEKKANQRGRSFERAIRKLFASYESRGIHCQQNHPEQLHDGTLVKKHGFDFQIFYNGKFYAFDAKECALTAWPLDKAKPHQLKALLDVEYNGGEGFFLVYFKKTKKIIKFNAKIVQDAIINKKHTLSPEDGESTTINLLRIK